MLTITPEALTVIQQVTDHPTLEPTSGVRIAPLATALGSRTTARLGAPLQVRAVNRPVPGDRVWERDGARLFLEEEALPRLRDRELDAVTDEEGRVQFVLRSAA